MMIGRVHQFAALGDDQMRFERAATAYFAQLTEKLNLPLCKEFELKRAFFGDAGGFIATTFELPKPAAGATKG
jgi:hypothetical protein